MVRKKEANTGPATPANNVDPSAAEYAERIFNEDTVKKLQQKIQDGMQKVTIRGRNDKKGQQMQKGKEQAKSGAMWRKDKREQGGSITAGKKNPALQHISNEPQGKKRSYDGREGPQPTANPASANGNSKRVAKKNVTSKKKSISDEDLLKEILELGGTKDDLDMVKDIDPDDDNVIIEGGSTVKGGKGLRGDLQKLIAEIGHDLKTSVLRQVVPGGELLEGGEGGGGEEDRDDSDEDEEEDEETGEPKVNGTKMQETTSVPPKPTGGKLVCCSTPSW